VPAAYKETAGWKVAQPKDDTIRGTWWEMFGDPQLNALEGQVNISNQNVVQAESQFRQARALAEAARAAYYPTLSLGASVTRSGRPSGSGLTAGSTTGSSAGRSNISVTDFLLPLDISWEPDIWGKVRRTVESSQANAVASAADLEAVRLTVHSEVAQNYFQLRSLDAAKQLLDATVAAYRKSLELTTNRYQGGVASRAEVLQAETQLKSTEAQYLDIGVQRAQLEHAIALLVGKAASEFSIPFSPLDTVPPVIPVGLPSALLERRPDIAAAERRVAAANAQIGVAKAAYFPTVTLSASGGFEGSTLANWLTWPSRFWSVGPAVSETLFDGGLRRAESDQARAAYDGNVAAYRQTVLTGFQEVEDNLASLHILDEEAKVQNEAVKAAQQTVELTSNQYKNGTVSYLNVIVTQTIELSNRRTAVDILGRRMAASVLLIKALGGGWDLTTLPSVEDLKKRDTSRQPAGRQ
jgi:NodT family efflux transporter outer membrane factor (OMF) lipoprotein